LLKLGDFQQSFAEIWFCYLLKLGLLLAETSEWIISMSVTFESMDVDEGKNDQMPP
jgi:hypothetical protein